ncbi:hypothetical protein AKJ08_0678 [Vulgatibacter incomptus]|uniref:Uncharacterized protein n=1 Tax=Vulgatibacter incomptus TaxID=1391653 RepID=A0A0K1PA53_9BACT|nr:hypothetical protein AKJ08_0678 [Vulgatibacter incomptus]
MRGSVKEGPRSEWARIVCCAGSGRNRAERRATNAIEGCLSLALPAGGAHAPGQ